MALSRPSGSSDISGSLEGENPCTRLAHLRFFCIPLFRNPIERRFRLSCPLDISTYRYAQGILSNLWLSLRAILPFFHSWPSRVPICPLAPSDRSFLMRALKLYRFICDALVKIVMTRCSVNQKSLNFLERSDSDTGPISFQVLEDTWQLRLFGMRCYRLRIRVWNEIEKEIVEINRESLTGCGHGNVNDVSRSIDQKSSRRTRLSKKIRSSRLIVGER